MMSYIFHVFSNIFWAFKNICLHLHYLRDSCARERASRSADRPVCWTAAGPAARTAPTWRRWPCWGHVVDIDTIDTVDIVDIDTLDIVDNVDIIDITWWSGCGPPPPLRTSQLWPATVRSTSVWGSRRYRVDIT